VEILIISAVILCSAGNVIFNGTNQCTYSIIVCYDDSAGLSVSVLADPGRSVSVNSTDSEVSLASAVIWGYPGDSVSISDCISAKLQADLAEFTINGSSNTDLYAISNVVCLSDPPASLPFPASFRMLSQLKKKNTCYHGAHETSVSLAISNLNLR
jgi:hypothetical protein